MGERRIERTMKLETPIERDTGTLEELVFYEPTGQLQDDLEAAGIVNENVRKVKDAIHTGKLTLRHLTLLSNFEIGALTFRDRHRAMTIAGEILEGAMPEETPEEGGAGLGKS